MNRIVLGPLKSPFDARKQWPDRFIMIFYSTAPSRSSLEKKMSHSNQWLADENGQHS